MSFQIENQEPLPSGISRILHTELDWAINSLESENQHEGVHEARKSFKKIRAILRMVRDQIGKENYQYENVWFRDAGRQISSLRDATALIETLEEIRNKYHDEIDEELIQSIQTNLEHNRDEIENEILSNTDTVNRVAKLVAEGKKRLK
ncbi:MAG: CHAD domain-containing protein, partial [Bacteroidetes bacterium]|nr:CHAD domain-containing protein [Bacteroidota bacterium]